MNRHISEYYSAFSDETPSGNFHDVIVLHDSPQISWEEVLQKAPHFSRGWYELARLDTKDRLEFLQGFWSAKLPFHPRLTPFLERFFDTLDDIGVYLTQASVDEPYIGELVYSLGNEQGFYRGALPASLDDIVRLQSEFAEYTFPKDYLSFLQIHNGFCKATDVTGLTPAAQLKELYINFQEVLKEYDTVTTTAGDLVEPKSLIPFYESFGLSFFQCFYADWYPKEEMGNLYFSPIERTVPDFKNEPVGSESLAFPTFIDWLMFYLEKVE